MRHAMYERKAVYFELGLELNVILRSGTLRLDEDLMRENELH